MPKLLIDTKTRLTEKERNILGRAVKKVINSVFEREKNSLRLRILTDKIAMEAQFQTTLAIIYKEFELLEAAKKLKKKGK